jgi:hypothetical protein
VLIVCAALLTGCAIDLPRQCRDGYWLESVRSDRGTEYVCVKKGE